MNNCSMTHPMRIRALNTILLILTLLLFVITSCSNSEKEQTENKSVENDSLESGLLETCQNPLEPLKPSENSNINPSEIDQNYLDATKSAYQAKLDSGTDMLGTSCEEYLFLVELKDAYKSWLSKNCTTGFKNYETQIDNWEASVESQMNMEEKKYNEEEMGNDMYMIVYDAGSQQMYL